MNVAQSLKEQNDITYHSVYMRPLPIPFKIIN